MLMNDGSSQLPLQRLTKEGSSIQKEAIVEETAIQLDALNPEGNLYSHATLLATPIDLIELHAGHILAEGYVSCDLAIESFVHKQTPHHVIEYQGILEVRPRDRIVTSSCGACNHPDLLVQEVKGNIESKFFKNLDLDFVNDALNSLTKSMELFHISGGSHGSGLFIHDEGLRYVSEDIGRHNAVDKTIGKAALDGYTDFNASMLLLSGRCGWDIVAKAIRTGIPAISSLGAFSSAAIQLAREHGLILYGFVKKEGAWKAGH